MRRLLAALAVLLVAPAVLADGAKPAVLGLTEVAPGQFDVVFRVPRSGTRIPALRPVLPDACRVITEPEVEITPDGQVTRWRISAAPWEVAGKPIRIEGLAAAINDTVVRFRFLDGSIVTRIIMPEMPVTEFPARVGRSGETGGRAAAAPRAVRAMFVDGARHAILGPAHLVFVLGLVLVGRFTPVLRALTAFALAHVAGILAVAVTGASMPLAPAEALLAVGGVVAASRRTGLAGIATVAGLLHGAALAAASPDSILPPIATTIGIDAAQIVLAVVAVPGLRALAGGGARVAAGYAVGVAGVFLALLTATETESAPPRAPGAPLLLTLIPSGPGGPASVPLSPAQDAPVRVFLAVEPVEVRVEAVLRAGVITEPRDVIPVDEQEEVKRRLEDLVSEGVKVRIDGREAAPGLTRIDFVEQGTAGVLERPKPVPEPFPDARLGAVLVFPVRRVPDEVSVSWGIVAEGEPVSATVVDPERTYVTEGAEIAWRNELREPPAPEPSAVERRRPRFRASALSILLLAGGLVWLGTRRGRTALGVTASRLGVAAAAFVAPVLPVTLPLPSGAVPEDAEARAIVESLLTNVHRAFDHHDESDVYERLAVSVAGDELTNIYLEHRRILLLAAQGGARARADSVEVDSVRDVSPTGDGGFRAEVEWRVSGFVVHFGHRHLRRNTYRAGVAVIPDGEAWKIRAIEVKEKRRIR